MSAWSLLDCFSQTNPLCKAYLAAKESCPVPLAAAVIRTSIALMILILIVSSDKFSATEKASINTLYACNKSSNNEREFST